MKPKNLGQEPWTDYYVVRGLSKVARNRVFLAMKNPGAQNRIPQQPWTSGDHWPSPGRLGLGPGTDAPGLRLPRGAKGESLNHMKLTPQQRAVRRRFADKPRHWRDLPPGILRDAQKRAQAARDGLQSARKLPVRARHELPEAGG